MQRPAVIILSMLTQGAIAQCVVPANPAHPVSAGDRTHAVAAAARSPKRDRPSAELIKTATASTRGDAPAAVRDGAPHADAEDHPHGGGGAMLLAALALMSGIVLRRYGADGP